MMKAVILAGGLGTRISEESYKKPKPMIEICGKPILCHIMENLSNHGINEFVICLGYMGYQIKEYFMNFNYHNNDLKINFETKKIETTSEKSKNWIVELVDTGENTMTGGRLKRVKSHLRKNENFLFTYGDGVSDINIKELEDFHIKHKKLATITAVKPLGRYGAIDLSGDKVLNFTEKPQGDVGWINGGFFILNPKCIDYIDNDNTFWEQEPLHNLVKNEELMAFKHTGFWHAMDTIRDKLFLENLFLKKKLPW